MQMSWLHQAFRECRSESGTVPRLNPAVLVRGAAGERDGNRLTGYGGKGLDAPDSPSDATGDAVRADIVATGCRRARPHRLRGRRPPRLAGGRRREPTPTAVHVFSGTRPQER